MHAVFTGGTGRSGTTVLGHLLDNHPEIGRTMPREVRFITERGGLIDLVAGHSAQFATAIGAPLPGESASLLRRGLLRQLPRQLRLRAGGRVELNEFIDRVRGYWFYRVGKDGKERGLHRGLPKDTLNSAIEKLETTFVQNPLEAGRDFTIEILSAISSGKPGWVETTPDNVIRAEGLRVLMPNAKVIHVVRDGRDVASSVVGRAWGPDGYVSALRWWGKRMHRAYSTLQKMAPEAALTLRLEDLAVRDRDASYQRLIDFVGIEDAPALRSFFDEFIIERRLHQGRWRAELTGVSPRQFNDLYGQILTSLQSQFGDVAPTQDLLTR
jgi:hypothetical protein